MGMEYSGEKGITGNVDFLRYWFKFFVNGFNWLFPAQCAVCGERIPGGAGICVDCHARIPVAEEACPQCGAPERSGGEASARICGACQTQSPSFDEVIAGSLYRQPVSQLIQAFKFGGKLHLAPILATLLRRQIKLEGSMPDLIAPVPVFNLYNQQWPVYTYRKALPPAKVSRGSVGEPSFVDGSQELWTEGHIDGRITEFPRGNAGFGYDPIFYVPQLEKTFAELSTEEKNKISHRGIALQKLRKILVNVLN